MATAQGAQCCCDCDFLCSDDTPGCLFLETVGVTRSGDCVNCDDEIPVDGEGYLPSLMNSCTWQGLFCSNGGAEGDSIVRVTDVGAGDYKIIASIGTVVWSKIVTGKPDCNAWDEEELTYDAGLSNLSGLDYDPTTSTLKITATESCEVIETCPDDTPVVTIPCLQAVIAGLATVDCQCGNCDALNDTFQLAHQGSCGWAGVICQGEILDKFCGYETVQVYITDNADGTYTIIGELFGPTTKIAWSKTVIGKPNCLDWTDEVLDYDEGLSDLVGHPSYLCDGTSSTMSITALPSDTVCDDSDPCPDPPDECPTSTAQTICIEKKIIPMQLRVVVPSGHWVDTDPFNTCGTDVGPCPEGEFILENQPGDGRCNLSWQYFFPTGDENCEPFAIVASYVKTLTYTDQAGPFLIVVISWLQNSTWFNGARFVLCLEPPEDCDDEIDCWLGGVEFEVPFNRNVFVGAPFDNSPYSLCVWDGLINNHFLCANPSGGEPITAQFLP